MSELTEHKIAFDSKSVYEEVPKVIEQHYADYKKLLDEGKYIIFNYIDTRVGCSLLSLRNPYILQPFIAKLLKNRKHTITGPIQISKECKILVVVSVNWV